MFKKSLIVLPALLMVGVISGCSTTDSTVPNPASTATATTTAPYALPTLETPAFEESADSEFEDSENGSEEFTDSVDYIELTAEEAEIYGLNEEDGEAQLTLESVVIDNGTKIKGSIVNLGKVDDFYDVVMLDVDGEVIEAMTVESFSGFFTNFTMSSEKSDVAGVRIDGDILGKGVSEIFWGEGEPENDAGYPDSES